MVKYSTIIILSIGYQDGIDRTTAFLLCFELYNMINIPGLISHFFESKGHKLRSVL